MPIRWRLTVFNALAIGVILLVLGMSLYFLLRSVLLANVEETVGNRAESLAGEIEDREDARDLTSGDDLEGLTRDGVFFVVRDERGDVLAQTIELATGEDLLWERALETGRTVSGTARLSGEAPDFVRAVPVDPPEGAPIVVEAGKSYGDVEETLAAFRRVLVGGIGAALLLSVLGAYLLARAALRPVGAVTEAARRMTDEDLSARLPVANAKDEVGRLTTTINALLSRLEAAFARRDEALRRQRRFVSDAGHEIRTPLTSVGGYARMLEAWGLEHPDKAREGVAAIRRESERMGGLVEGLLALARGDEGAPMNPETADLVAVVGEAVETARAAANGKVEIWHNSPEAPVVATFDRDRLREAVSILLDNAVKYTPAGGDVTVRVLQRDGEAAIEVADNGVGIPEDHLPLVFERFHRVDESRSDGGAGLGLAIARRISEAHGGRIGASSEQEEGSTFTLLLPNGPR